MDQNRVLLFDTALYTSNQGDEIIYRSVQDGMSDILDRYSVLRLATHTPNFFRIQLRKPNRKLRIFLDTQLKFVCGTNLLTPYVHWRNYHRQWQLYNYNKALYQGCVLIGAGLTNYTKEPDRYTRKLLTSVLSDQYAHSVRDEKTKTFAESLGKRALNTGCPTLWGLTPEFCQKIPQKKSDNCVISLSGYASQQSKAHDKSFLDVIKRSYSKKYLWVQTEYDEAYFSKLEEDPSQFEKIYSLNRLSAVLNRGNIDYIGTRLHGGVYALMHGVRSLVIAIDDRARGFHESNNLPIVEREQIDSELEGLIFSDRKTEIKNNVQAIQEFKSQF